MQEVVLLEYIYETSTADLVTCQGSYLVNPGDTGVVKCVIIPPSGSFETFINVDTIDRFFRKKALSVTGKGVSKRRIERIRNRR